MVDLFGFVSVRQTEGLCGDRIRWAGWTGPGLGALTSGGRSLPHAGLGHGELHRAGHGAGHGLAFIVGDGEPPPALVVEE